MHPSHLPHQTRSVFEAIEALGKATQTDLCACVDANPRTVRFALKRLLAGHWVLTELGAEGLFYRVHPRRAPSMQPAQPHVMAS